MASASLGRLTLDLVAQIGQFVGPMTQAERKAKESTAKMGKAFSDFKEQMNASLGGTQIGSAIEGITGKLGALRGGVLTATASLAGMAVGGLVVAGGALSQMSLDLAKADAELNRLSRRAVTSAENFQIVAGAASAFGVEQDKLSDILADTSEKLGEYTSTKGGEAKEFFEMLANNTKMTSKEIDDFAKKLSTMDTVDALGLITEKLDDMGTTAAEKRFILESLASDLGDLAPLFSNNSALIKEYGDQLREAGVVRTQESIDKSLLLNAQTQALGTQFQGFKNQLASQMTPVLSNLIQYFVDGAVKSGSFGTVLSSVGTIAKIVGVAIVGVASAVSVVIQSISGFANLINHIGVVAARLDAATTISDQINVLKTGFSEGKDIWNDTAAGIDKTIRSAMAFVSNTQTSTMPTLTGLSAAQLKVNQANLANSKSTITDTETAKENAKAKEEQAKAAAKAAKAQQDLNKMVGASALNGLRIKGAESIAGGQVRAYTANFAQLVQSALGKDLNRFTAFNDTYHKGTNSKHATGNAFDFTLGDVKKSDEAVTQLEQMAKRYGFVIKVIDEYRNPSSRATGGHIHVSVLGYKGTADALKDANAELDLVQKANDEALKIHDERERKQLAVVSKYSTVEQKMALDNEQSIKDIKIAFAGDDESTQKYLKIQEEAYKKDVLAYRQAQQEKFDSYKNDLLGKMADAEDAIALSGIANKFGRNSFEYQMAGLTTSVRQEKSYELDDYTNDVNQINKDYDSPEMATQRYELLEQAKAAHLAKMKALDFEYQDSSKQLIQEQHESQLNLYGSLLSQASTVWGSMTQMVKEAKGENSKTYKAMFLAQQGIAIAQQIINTELAAMQPIAQMGIYGIPASTLIRGLGYASIAVIGAQTIAGFADGGFTGYGGKYETAGIVHKGEGVLTQEEIAALGGPSGFNALRQSIKNGYANGGIVSESPTVFTPKNIESTRQRGGGVNVNINVPPGYTARERRASNGDVTIDIVRQEVEQAFTRLGTQANSHESQMMQQGFMVERNRG
ncbi:TPA: hypothetical protein JI092_11940 [Acinetobacter baumannii]|nr:hypothetical protein [Acinetobacter baumannii]